MAELAKRLKRARELAGLTQIQVARSLGLRGASTISQYESGRRRPDTTMLERLARLYGVSVGFFFEEDDPAPTDWPGALRKVAGGQEHGILTLVERVQAMAWLMAQAEPSYRPSRSEYRALDDSAHPTEAAFLAARYRGALAMATAPVASAKLFLEDQGIHVFVLSLDRGVRSLFFVHPALGPVVAINLNRPQHQFSVDLAHALAHALVHYDRPALACHNDSHAPTERFADSFAEHFLLPDDGILRWLAKQGLGHISNPSDVIRLAQAHRVSYALAKKRLGDLGKLRGARGRFDEIDPQTLALHLGYHPTPTDPRRAESPAERLPRKLIEWILAAIHRGILSADQAAKLLGVANSELQGLLRPRAR